MPIWEFVLIVGASLGSVAVILAWLSLPRNGATTAQAPQTSAVSFLFDHDMLHHASDRALRLHRLVPGQDSWNALRQRMLDRFPDFPDSPDSVPGPVTYEAVEPEDQATLRVSQNGGYTEVHVQEGFADDQASVDMRELENLRRASDTTPHPVWQRNADGKVAWHNRAYEALYIKLHNAPPQVDRLVFPTLDNTDEPFLRKRVSTQDDEDGKKNWYDVSAVNSGDVTVFHAIDVNAVVNSEAAQRNFVQTLAKTFAQLSIGLAIFDRNGQLALFNPALIDLTSLPADFLSARPTLMSFFDRLRENRRMPEPKNYRSWRQEIAEVIAAATDGRYQETWTLETGQTYRVHGRPHPDGAIAFLIEDISAEVSLTRNFRAELELGQSLMDTFDEALVVFSSTGVLTFCNLAYRSLWGLDPDSSFADVTITDSVREWKRLCAPGARWAALTDSVMDYSHREIWDMPAVMKTGQRLECRVSPVASGATVIRFSQVENAKQSAPRKQRLPRSS